MFRCLICGKRHYKGSIPAQWCNSSSNPDYVAYLLKRHNQGFHAAGTGGHKDCPSCRMKTRPEQLQKFRTDVTPVAQVLDICGCQG